MDQPGKVANPARGQLNRENNISLSPCMPENLVSRDGFSRPVPRQPAHLHTQAESGAYGFYVWEDVPEGGLLSGLYFVSILEQQYSWWRFYLAFSNTLGFYSACLPFRFF